MCIWRDPESCDWLKCLLSIIYILWISNFDIVFGYIMKKLALAPDCLRGGCICKIIFPLFYLYTIFLFLSFNYKTEQRMTATLGLDKDPFTWKTTFIMSDFLFKWIFIYCSDLGIPNLYEMTACRPFYLIAVLHLNYLLCLYKLWTCHIHFDPPPHLSVCIFFHCNFPLCSSVGFHRLFLEFIKKQVCCLGRKLHLHAWERPKVFYGGWQMSWLFYSFGREEWENGVVRREFWKGEK